MWNYFKRTKRCVYYASWISWIVGTFIEHWSHHMIRPHNVFPSQRPTGTITGIGSTPIPQPTMGFSGWRILESEKHLRCVSTICKYIAKKHAVALHMLVCQKLCPFVYLCGMLYHVVTVQAHTALACGFCDGTPHCLGPRYLATLMLLQRYCG